MKANPTTALMTKIKKHPTWRIDIGPWMKGQRLVGRFPDLPRRDRKHRLYISSVSVRFIGPFAQVNVILDPARKGIWVAAVSHCANPVSQDYTDTDKLVNDFCGSILHTAIRGVIG